MPDFQDHKHFIDQTLLSNMKYGKPVILFDGVCNLCNSSVNFIIDRDDKDIFRFAAIQSHSGKKILKQFGLNPDNLYSIILIENDRYHDRSNAALRIAKRLKGLWKFSYVFIIVPSFIRNILYGYIAKNRYRWFGKRESCRIPTKELRDKFLE